MAFIIGLFVGAGLILVVIWFALRPAGGSRRSGEPLGWDDTNFTSSDDLRDE